MRPAPSLFCAGLLGLAALAGCAPRTDSKAVGDPNAVDRVLDPTELHRALRAAGGGRWTATTTMKMTAKGAVNGSTITTTTSLAMDVRGHVQFTETNDQGGGRSVTRVGRDLVVGLHPGKPIRRQAQEPEPTRLVEEALGGPAAAWEIARSFTRIDRSDEGGALKIQFVKTAPGPRATPATALRKWRGTVEGIAVAGQMLVDTKTHLPRSLHIDVQFALSGEGQPMQGQIVVDAKVADVGLVTALVLPDAGDLQIRQRTILEERALLTDLPNAAGPRK